jgi:hypothetical protein
VVAGISAAAVVACIALVRGQELEQPAPAAALYRAPDTLLAFLEGLSLARATAPLRS